MLFDVLCKDDSHLFPGPFLVFAFPAHTPLYDICLFSSDWALMPKYHGVTSQTWHAGKPAPCVSLNVGKTMRQCQIREGVKSWKKSNLKQREKKRKRKEGEAYSGFQCFQCPSHSRGHEDMAGFTRYD